MTDTIRLRLFYIRVINSNNFYCTTTKGKKLPYINTLSNLACYGTIPSDGNFQAYRLMSYLKMPNGYIPALIEIRDIPFTKMRFSLVVEVAQPKILNGHNLWEIYDYQCEEVIHAIYVMLLQFGIEISIEELQNTQNISRIDFCKNIIIQTPVKNFISLLQKLKKQRSKTNSEYSTTVYYDTKKKRLVVYDKIKEVIAKADKNPESITYKLAKLLITLQEISNIQVIRVEQRLYGRQAIIRELAPIIDSKEITFKSLFSHKVASYILNKHWSNLAHEEKFKTLLLGGEDLHTIFTETAKVARQQQKKNNPFFALYPKLLSDIGEEATNKDIKGMRSSRRLIDYKKELFDLVKLIPLYDTRLTDFRIIAAAIANWDTFSLPIMPS